jgi:hypothetical protein
MLQTDFSTEETAMADEAQELRAENDRLRDEITEAYEERNHARDGWEQARGQAAEFKAALTTIGEGRVPLGPYGEMWQAIEAYAREVLANV